MHVCAGSFYFSSILAFWVGSNRAGSAGLRGDMTGLQCNFHGFCGDDHGSHILRAQGEVELDCFVGN